MEPWVWRAFVFLGFVIPLGIFLTACGTASRAESFVEDSSTPVADSLSGVAAQRIHIAADPSGALRWDQTTYTAVAGNMSFVVRNDSPVAHQFTINGPGVNYRSGVIKARSSFTLTMQGMPAGTYQIICDYPGHQAAGMVSQLVVR